MKLLIVGGAGFVGANLALYFSDKGCSVTCLDNLARRGGEFNLPLFKQKRISFIHGDIRCREDFPKDKFDFVCECSAQPSAIDGYNNPYYDFSNNTLGLMNVLEFCRISKTPLLFWSTNKVYCGDNVNWIRSKEEKTRYVWDETFIATGISESFSIDGGDHSIYGMSKAMSDIACQEYCQAFNVPIVINRFSCLAGQRQWGKCAQGWVAWWAIAAHFDLPVTYIGWKGKQVRDVLFIDDLCCLIELEIENIDKIKGQVFNVGGGMNNTLSLIEATELMERKFRKKMTVNYDPIPRKSDHCIYISDITKIKSAVGWDPKIGIEEGYDKIIQWVKENSNILVGMYLK